MVSFVTTIYILTAASFAFGVEHSHVHHQAVATPTVTTLDRRDWKDTGDFAAWTSTYKYDPTSSGATAASTVTALTALDMAFSDSASSTTILSSSSSSVSSASSSSLESSKPTSAPSNSSNTLDSYSSAFGIAFSQYDDNGDCKSEAILKSNFEALSGYSVIRLYHTDCSVVEHAFKYKKSSQKLLIGIYDPTGILSSVSTIQSAFSDNIGSGSYEDHIYAVTVGNEHVNDGKYTASQMVSFLQTAKEKLSAIGYNGKVAIVDTFNAIQSNPELCTTKYSSFVAANAHPYFSGVEASTAGSWVKNTISDLASACGVSGKDGSVLITESGWPTKGDSIGNAVPSSENQHSALSSDIDQVSESVVLFSGWNEFWKQPGDYNVEQYWGIQQ